VSFKIKFNKGARELLNGTYHKKVRKEFYKRGPVKVKQAIVQDMIKGISPVKGGGKWKKYSEVYKAAIKGEAFLGEDGEYFIIRTINGRPVRINVEEKKLARNLIQEQAVSTKRITPVNLRLSGALHRSLKVFITGKALGVVFAHFLADIHNRLGAGKSKVIRRLLPTNRGEQFNRRINSVILAQLKKAADKVAKQISGQ